MFSGVSERASACTHLKDTNQSHFFFATGLHTAAPHAKAGIHPFLSVCSAILWSGVQLVIMDTCND